MRLVATASNKKVSGSGRLEAAFDPTGREQGEEKIRIAWSRKAKHSSRMAGGRFGNLRTLSETGVIDVDQ
jgi:hypothetical protein